jgi:uncharacterized protein YggU (UPF0235/DUF167 family)
LSSVKLSVKVVAGSSRSGIAGWLGNTLRIRVAAPAERGKANAAVEALLSDVLEIPAGGAKIISGSSSPRKVVEIVGLSEAQVRQKLSDAAATAFGTRAPRTS